MDFSLKFDMDNDAFSQYPEGEVNRILNRVGEKVVEGATYGNIIDLNGNKVGEWSFSD